MTEGRRIEVRPTGTNGEPSCEDRLFDEDGRWVCEIPASYVTPNDPDEARYVVLDLSLVAPPLWGERG